MINDGERALHTHLGDALKYFCSVGGTHWDHLGSGRDLPGPKPALFFAPAQIKKRNAEWGAGALQTRIAQAWRAFMRPVMDAQSGWVRVVAGNGLAEVARVYRDMLDRRVRPDEGHVCFHCLDAVAENPCPPTVLDIFHSQERMRSWVAFHPAWR